MRSKNRGYCPEESKMKNPELSLSSRGKNSRNPEQNLLRLQDQKATVSDLVYKYLRKIAYSSSVKKQRNNACGKFRRRNARRKTIHPPRRYTNIENNEAKSYIRDALQLAVHSGYLIPTDRIGKCLRLSSNITLYHGDAHE